VFLPRKRDKCVNEIIFYKKPQKPISNLLNTASVNMTRSVEADFLIFIHLYDPTILDYQGYSPETD
jgi:hypothetical protein